MTVPNRPLSDYERALQFRNNASRQYDLETRLTWQGFLNWLRGISSDMVRIAQSVERSMGHAATVTTSITDFLNNILSLMPRRS
jgi:hypothetical protein